MAQNSSYVTVDGEFDSLEDRSFLTIDDYDLSGHNVILRIDIILDLIFLKKANSISFFIF